MSEAAKLALRVFRRRREQGKKLRYRERESPKRKSGKAQKAPFTLSPGVSLGQALFDYCTAGKPRQRPLSFHYPEEEARKTWARCARHVSVRLGPLLCILDLNRAGLR